MSQPGAELLTFGDRLPQTDDPIQLRLLEALRADDVRGRADAALRLGVVYLKTQPRIAEKLLRQACDGPPITAGRALLRLAYAKFRTAGTTPPSRSTVAAVQELLVSARDLTRP